MSCLQACYLLEYSDAQPASDDYYQRSYLSGDTLQTTTEPNPNAPYLPTPYQYLADFGLLNWGGYSHSMDYAPVRYGIWNCQVTVAGLHVDQ